MWAGIVQAKQIQPLCTYSSECQAMGQEGLPSLNQPMMMVSSHESTSRVQHMVCAIRPPLEELSNVVSRAERRRCLKSHCVSKGKAHVTPLCKTKPQHSLTSPFCTRVTVVTHSTTLLVPQQTKILFPFIFVLILNSHISEFTS